MAATPDGDGSLLDHSLFMYGSNMSNSDRHNNYPLPIILVGGAQRRAQGRPAHRRCPSTRRSPTCISRCSTRSGLELKSFADSTGEIAGRLTRTRMANRRTLLKGALGAFAGLSLRGARGPRVRGGRPGRHASRGPSSR